MDPQLAVAMVFLNHGTLSYLGFALRSPVMVVGNYATDRRSGPVQVPSVLMLG